MNRIPAGFAAAGIALSLTFSVGACSHSGSTTHVTASQKAVAKKDFTQLTRKCLPADAVGQVKLVKSLGTKAGRNALLTKCGIPPERREVTEAKILNAMEHGHLSTHDGRVTFFTVTLPTIIAAEQK